MVENNIAPVKNKDFTQVKNVIFTAVENKSSAPLDNKDPYINYVFDENYLYEAFLGKLCNQQKVFIVKYHMKEFGKVLTKKENTELSALNMEILIFKRIQQLKSKTTRFFRLKSHQIELKIEEIHCEQIDNKRKKVYDFNDFKKKLKLNLNFLLLNEFYGCRINIIKKQVELYMLRLNSLQIYNYDIKKFLKNIAEKKIATLNCIKC